ncbi:MAG: hypothetical protein SF182_02055 [Deltaproteobacteria bacterium]|nr:hypothetical protein [Deltaproteobacteria bacterium]
MRFDEIEHVIGTNLPPAAFKHRAWWSNNPSNSVITRAWLNAGFKTEQVDMAARTLVFRRFATAAKAGSDASGVVGEKSPTYGKSERHPLFGALKGLTRVTEGTDLTQPADPEWGDATR